MSSEKPIRFPCGDFFLDGRICVPPSATQACVVCHPHPLYGGNMSNGVVVAVTEALARAGVATLRFDFRGVGSSDGSHGGGEAEVHDARAAVAALASTSGIGRVAIAGYSFGSVIALRTAESGCVAAAAAIAPPLAMFDATFVAAIAAPVLLVAGDRDEYCPAAAFDALGRRLPATASAVKLAGGDHFLGGREAQVAAAVAEWLLALPQHG